MVGYEKLLAKKNTDVVSFFDMNQILRNAKYLIRQESISEDDFLWLVALCHKINPGMVPIRNGETLSEFVSNLSAEGINEIINRLDAIYKKVNK